MSKLLRRWYQPQYMVKDSLKRGAIPSTREGYGTAFSTAWAAILETFLIALIGMADTLMVSTVGDAAIAAVGIATQPRYLVQTLVLAINIAVTSICARRRGQEDRQGATNCLKQGLILSFVSSVIITLLVFPFTGRLITFMGAEPATYTYAYDYFTILLLGLPLYNVSLTISSAQRGIGETKASMYINMSANIVNIILNYILINGKLGFPALGVRGAAYATVIGYGVGLLVALYTVLTPGNYLQLSGKAGWRFDKRTLSSMFQVASGSFVEQVFLRTGFIFYAKVVALLGSVMIAAHQILMNIMSLSFSFGEGFGIAASSLVGQQLGAKRPDLSIVYGKIAQRMSLVSSGVLFFVFTFFGKNMVMAFTDTPEIIEASRVILIIIAFIIFGQASQMVFMGALRGAGDTKYTAIVSMVSIMVLRPLSGYFFAVVLNGGLVGAWVGMILDQFLRLILTYVRFSSGKWTEIEL